MGIESNKEAVAMMKNALGSIENRFREAYNKGYKDGINEGINRAMQKIADSILEEAEAESQTCSFSDCDNFKNPDYARCIECKRKQIESKDKPQTCYTCEYEWRDGTDEPCVYCYGGSKYKPEDEPTER